jgi:hypothetical protein
MDFLAEMVCFMRCPVHGVYAGEMAGLFAGWV